MYRPMPIGSNATPNDGGDDSSPAPTLPRSLRVLLVLDFLVCGFGIALGWMLATSGGDFVDLSGLGTTTLVVSVTAALLDLAAWSARRSVVSLRASLAFLLALIMLALLALRLPAYPVVLGVSALNLLIFGACLRHLTRRHRQH